MGLFSDNGPTDSSGCPIPKGVESLTVHGTSHRTMYILSGVCAIITLVGSTLLILLHLSRYRAPREQRQIVRIVFMPFMFAIVAWAEIKDYKIAPYIDPIGEVYESWAICAIFLLFIQFAAPNSTFNEEMFLAVSGADETGSKGGNWPKLSWILVFQFPITEIIATIVLEATEAAGTYCMSSLKPKFGHFWVQIIRLIGVVLAAMTVIRFHKRMKRLMKARRGALKLFAFKGFIFLHFIQTWVFSILITRNAIHHSATFSYGDLLYGLPAALTAVETVILTAIFWYAYSPGEYSSSSHPGKPFNFFHAIVHSLNPSDLILGILRAFRLALFPSSTASTGGYYYGGFDNQYRSPGASGNGYYDERGVPLSTGGNRAKDTFLEDNRNTAIQSERRY